MINNIFLIFSIKNNVSKSLLRFKIIFFYFNVKDNLINEEAHPLTIMSILSSYW
jgi:hypothetical protein